MAGASTEILSHNRVAANHKPGLEGRCPSLGVSTASRNRATLRYDEHVGQWWVSREAYPSDAERGSQRERVDQRSERSTVTGCHKSH